ncbi:peptidase G2 autoproteolytic cleavage domain-containing protein [Bacillus sp. SA1-12]|nr:peptidase G2 autoproteolytic cleavage domain-containing protein [Bacillus sp. SA1-12]
MQWKVNPDWNPEREYISRLKRPEWVAIGLQG